MALTIGAISIERWGEFVVLLAAVVTALGVLHVKVIKPLIQFAKRLVELLDRGIKVIEWVERDFGPTLELMQSHTQLLSAQHRRLEVLEEREAQRRRRRRADELEQEPEGEPAGE